MDHDVSAMISELVDLVGSQSKLAKRLKISQPTVSKWINGEQEPLKSQWDAVLTLYAELKGWVWWDNELRGYPDDVRRDFEDMAGRWLRRMPKLPRSRR
jgi:transcriptional regulator with XRE-family HTH domain